MMDMSSGDRPPASRRWFVAGLAAAMASPPRRAAARTLIRAAAADHLSRVFPTIVADYARATGRTVAVTFGRPELLVRRIGQGERFDLFVGVGEEPVEQLHAEKLAANGGAIYAYGKLAVATLRERAIVVDSRLDGLKVAAHDGRLRMLIVPDPSMLRIGAAIAGALAATGLELMLRPEQVLHCTSVVETLHRLLDGEGEAAIVANQTIVRFRVEERLRFAIIERSLHAPLPQRMVLLAGHDGLASEFFAYLLEPPAQRSFATYGFDPVISAT